MQKETYRKILLSWVLLLVTLPLLQHYFNIFKEPPLEGAIDKPAFHPFTISDWLSGSFQNDQEIYLAANYGFHNTIVRLNNQLDFSLFQKGACKRCSDWKEKLSL
jgi:hypothetical protein